MIRAFLLIEWVIGIVVAVWLFSRASATYVLPGLLKALLIAILYTPAAVILWRRLTSERRPLLVTGFSILMSLGLVARITSELSLVAFPGWSSKEMGQAVPRDVPSESVKQWYMDEITRIRSERNIYIVMSAVLCLLVCRQFTRIQRDPKVIADKVVG